MVNRAAVVANPTKVDDDERAAVEKALADAGWQCDWLETTPEDSGREQGRTAIENGADLVLVMGGDGTVMACLSAVAGTDTPLAILPAGTGNLLARHLGVPLDLAEALQVALTGADRPLDVGRVDDSCYAVMAGIGFDAAIMADAPEGTKRRLGWPAYLISGAKHLRDRPFRATITLDDEPPFSRKVRTVLVGNIGTLQGGLPLIPEAEPDDGVLDVALVAPRSLADWAHLGWNLLRRKPRAAPRLLETKRARHIEITLDDTQPRELDGEPIDAGRSMTVDVDARAVVVRVSPEAVENTAK